MTIQQPSNPAEAVRMRPDAETMLWQKIARDLGERIFRRSNVVLNDRVLAPALACARAQGPVVTIKEATTRLEQCLAQREERQG